MVTSHVFQIQLSVYIIKYEGNIFPFTHSTPIPVSNINGKVLHSNAHPSLIYTGKYCSACW